MKIALAVAVLFASRTVLSQPTGRDVALKLLGNVVRIEAQLADHTENGFGFIVGEKEGKLYIATAYHVVSDPQDVGEHPVNVKVEFYELQGETFPAKLLGTHDAARDLAVLTVSSPPGFHWNSTLLGDDAQQKVMTEVWFVGRSQKWFVPPSPGNVSDVSVDGRIDVDRLSVRPGSSGAPLIASSGIVGMVLRDSADEAQALSIEFIKGMFGQWNHPWDLRSAGGGAAAATEPAPQRSASTPEGMALVRKVIEFVGGNAKVEGIKALRTLTVVSAKMPHGPVQWKTDDLIQYPDKRRYFNRNSEGLTSAWVLTPATAFAVTPTGVYDISSSDREACQRQTNADFLMVLKNVGNPKYEFTASAADTLDINADGETMKWVVESATCKVLSSWSRETTREAVMEYTEWKSFDGITLPVAWNIEKAGQVSARGTMTLEIDPVIEPNEFAKP